MKTKLWRSTDIIAEYLKAAGIKLVVDLPGQGDAYFSDAINIRKKAFDIVDVPHEGMIGHILNTYSRASGGMIPAASVTEGVGLAQMFMGLRNLLLDATSTFIHVGQVTANNLWENDPRESHVFNLPDEAHAGARKLYAGRLNPFDHKYGSGLMAVNEESPFAKALFRPQSIDDVIKMMPEAIRALKTGRGGPVIFELPRNVAKETTTPFDILLPETKPVVPDAAAIDKFVEKILSAERPLFVFGEQMKTSGPEAYELAKKLVEKVQGVALTAFRQFDVYNNTSESFGGSFGLITPKHVEEALINSDSVFSIGHWLGGETTFEWKPGVFRGKQLTLVYNHAENFDSATKPKNFDVVNQGIYKPDLAITSDIVPFLEAVLEKLNAIDKVANKGLLLTTRKEWQEKVRRKQEEFVITPEESGDKTVHMPTIVKELFNFLKNEHEHFFITNDAGGNAVYFPHQIYDRPNMHGAPAMGSVGYASGTIGAVVGMEHAGKKGPVIGVMGDGSFNMYMGQLVLMANQFLRHSRAYHAVVVNNHGHAGIDNTMKGLALGNFSRVLYRKNPDYLDMVDSAFKDKDGEGLIRATRVDTTELFLP
ncbi:MAG: thiamine pyrophosphate-binding protein, partial [Rickettsiales bacterium]|nr:thiamine pyrophosphate-binding protein [Rickettsiales bacterium]